MIMSVAAADKRMDALRQIEQRDKQRFTTPPNGSGLVMRAMRYADVRRELYRRSGRCPECEGLGEWDEQHPQWGSRTCPEAYVRVKCEECNGSGDYHE